MPGKVAKSLPKRVTSTRRQERRKQSWQRGQERKKRRREEQEARHRGNIKNGTFVKRVKPAYRIFDPYKYGSHPGEPQAESIHQRLERERYWLALGKVIRMGLW